MTYVIIKDTATAEIYTLPLHDALPISFGAEGGFYSLRALRPRSDGRKVSDTILGPGAFGLGPSQASPLAVADDRTWRSEAHTSELQSRQSLPSRLLADTSTTATHAPP